MNKWINTYTITRKACCYNNIISMHALSQPSATSRRRSLSISHRSPPLASFTPPVGTTSSSTAPRTTTTCCPSTTRLMATTTTITTTTPPTTTVASTMCAHRRPPNNRRPSSAPWRHLRWNRRNRSWCPVWCERPLWWRPNQRRPVALRRVHS